MLFPGEEILSISNLNQEMPIPVASFISKVNVHRAPQYWLVHKAVVWDDMVTFEHIELGDFGSIELAGSVVVP